MQAEEVGGALSGFPSKGCSTLAPTLFNLCFSSAVSTWTIGCDEVGVLSCHGRNSVGKGSRLVIGHPSLMLAVIKVTASPDGVALS